LGLTPEQLRNRGIPEEQIQELMQMLKETGTTKGFTDRIVTFEERNRITGLDRYKEMEKKFLAQE